MASGLGNLRSILLSYRDRAGLTYHIPAGRQKGRAIGFALLLSGAAFWGPGAAAARDTARETSPPCRPEGGESVRIAGVGQDWSLSLADGRSLRLAGIDPVAPTPAHPALAEEARARLAGWLGGREAVLVPLGPGVDRWGRTAGLVFASGDPAPEGTAPAPPLSVALALVDAGMARGRPEPGVAGCWPALREAERGARDSGLGLWGDPYYAVQTSGDRVAGEDRTGTMVIVEGTVTRVGQGRTRLFIGLGRGDDEITVSIARRDLSILGQVGPNDGRSGGRDDHGLLGLTLQVRGDLDDRGGPSIDVTDGAQIEVVRPAPPPGSAVAPERAERD